MASSGEKTIALIKEFRALPEYDLYMSLKGFSISLYIFNQNYAELNAMIEFLANNPEAEKFMDARNRDRLNNLLDEAIRLLHNFVAAAMSLVDHTRNIYDKLYSKTGNFPDYQERINIEFANDPLVQFVHCLRQYCQHYKAPNISIKFSWKTGDEKLKKTIFLLKNDLKAFDSWNANAKKYLDLIEERVDIHEVAVAYRKKVLVFHAWFNSMQKEIHKTEFDVLRQKEEELLNAQLNHFLDAALFNIGKDKSGEVGIFYGIFDSTDYKKLDEIPMNSPKRCEKAIELLQGHIPVSDDIRKRISEWYEKQNQIKI